MKDRVEPVSRSLPRRMMSQRSSRGESQHEVDRDESDMSIISIQKTVILPRIPECLSIPFTLADLPPPPGLVRAVRGLT